MCVETDSITSIQVSVKSEIKHSIFTCFSPQLPTKFFSHQIVLTVQGVCAAAVMAWSSPDYGFAKIHVTTGAPSIPW